MPRLSLLYTSASHEGTAGLSAAQCITWKKV